MFNKDKVEIMKASELIKMLQALPPDAEVEFSNMSASYGEIIDDDFEVEGE